MSENNHAALALFAECDSLLQNLSPTDESALSGGGAKERRRRRRRKKRREKRREKMLEKILK